MKLRYLSLTLVVPLFRHWTSDIGHSAMIERYTLPKMGSIWEEKNKLQKWLDIEILACEAHAELGNIPQEAVAEIRAKATFDVARVKEIEREVHHDVVAFLTNVAENVGPASRYVHYGMTSSDVLDTGLALQMREAADVLIENTKRLIAVLKRQAQKYKDTMMIGRSHGVHAEPITFGLKLALWFFEMKRNLERLEKARRIISYGKISGTVGTYANAEPFVESYVCKKLGLKPAEASSQIIQRDRHAEFLCVLAITASSLEKFATEIRALQKTEVLEAEEPFAKGQKGSSAMPHKRNPVICERVCGLARLIRSNSLVGLENITLWHERDISHSSAERVIIPDSTILLDYIMDKFTSVTDNLNVYPENMKANLEKTKGLIFSQEVLLALISKGVLREDAYRMVQRNAMESWKSKSDFKKLILNDKEIGDYLGPEEIEEQFDYRRPLKHIDEIFERID